MEMMPEWQQEEIYARILADTVLLDWRETVDGKVAEHTITLESKKVKFAAYKALESLSDSVYKSLLTVVGRDTAAYAVYREYETE